MGNRVAVVFTDGKHVSPTCYLQWSRDDIPELLEKTRQVMHADKYVAAPDACLAIVHLIAAALDDYSSAMGVYCMSNTLQADRLTAA